MAEFPSNVKTRKALECDWSDELSRGKGRTGQIGKVQTGWRVFLKLYRYGESDTDCVNASTKLVIGVVFQRRPKRYHYTC